MPGTIYIPNLQVTIGGEPVQALSARAEANFADPVSKGYVQFPTEPSWNHGDELSIEMGNGYNQVERFRGTLLQGDYLNNPQTVSLTARGPLHRVLKYRNPNPKGTNLIELTGGPATDEQIVQAVLNTAGIPYVFIAGTGIVRGAVAPDGFKWKYGESAMEYINRLDQASLGYRLIESLDGGIYRTQVIGRPRGGDSDYLFTEGIDIYEGGQGQRSTYERYEAVTVSGFDYGDGLGPVSYTNGSANSVFAFSSPMFESIDDSDSRGGLSCAAQADYLYQEVNREVVRLSGMSTPRDDLIGPGQTHVINSLLLGVQESLWVMGVSCEITINEFVQTMEYIGGGSPGGGYEGP